MQYSLLYRYDPSGPGPVEEDVPKWIALADGLKEADALLHETGFFPASEGVTLRADAGGAPTTTKGVPAGDAVAGYFTIEVPSLDDAIEWASRLPVVGKGSVEIRQVVEFDG